MITFVLKSLFMWITSFLWHELMHIKSQGLQSRGTIFVNEYTMMATTTIKNYYWFKFAGGFLSGIFMLIFSLITIDAELQIISICCGSANLYYGIFEMYLSGRIDSHSYLVGRIACYLTGFAVTMISVLFWLWRITYEI